MNKPKSIFLAVILGNIIEYYDFTVYSVFSVVIGRTFFPGESEFIQVLASLGVFAVGFLTRPIGGIVFGYIGDKYGRRLSLIISMLGMTISTFIIGLIPSYEDIGFYAPLILIIIRLVQGLCISGEGVGVAIFILEHHQNLRPGLTAGLTSVSNIAGTLIATCIGIITEKYFPHVSSAWRYAFLLGGFIGLIGFYLRLRISETPIFQMLTQQKKTLKAPFIHVVKTARQAMLITFSAAVVESSVLYLMRAYVNIFYSNVMEIDNTTALMYLSYALFVAMLTMPLFGALVDIIGKFKMMVLASFAAVILVLPTLILMSAPQVWHQILALTCLGALVGALTGTVYIFIFSLFTPEQKFSGVAFSYNLGVTMFGGTCPIISRWLVEKTGLFYAPSFYIMTAATIFLLITYFKRDLIKKLISTNT